MHIYESDAALAEIVVRLVQQAVRMGQPALVICSLQAQAAILEQMELEHLDVESLRRQRLLEILDSREVIDLLVRNGQADADQFSRRMTALLDHLCRRRDPCVPVIYADIGDVLVKEGNAAAAVTLDTLWNLLATRFVCSLTCGYAAADLHEHIPRLEQLQAICDQHTVVKTRMH